MQRLGQVITPVVALRGYLMFARHDETEFNISMLQQSAVRFHLNCKGDAVHKVVFVCCIISWIYSVLRVFYAIALALMRNPLLYLRALSMVINVLMLHLPHFNTNVMQILTKFSENWLQKMQILGQIWRNAAEHLNQKPLINYVFTFTTANLTDSWNNALPKTLISDNLLIWLQQLVS